MAYEKYTHHGKEVTVRSDLKGKHRQYCLCYTCEKFVQDERCPIASKIFENCMSLGVVTPVFECPEFEEDYNG